MFENLTDKLQRAFKTLRGQGTLTEENISEALREIRVALLEADVNLNVAKDLIEQIRVKAVGTEVLTSLSPAEQVIKIVRDELITLLGKDTARFKFSSQPPTVILMAGLQGSGKTTTAGKLAAWLKKGGHRPMLVSVDVYRPAAREQLKVVAKQIEAKLYEGDQKGEPAGSALVQRLAVEARREARNMGCDTLIVDTAGRLQLDEQLMDEMEQLKKLLNPSEILFIADAMTGQDAVNSAAEFHRRLGLTGVVLTKMDGDARGGAALSIRHVTGQPIKFLGTGEKPDAFEPFHPDRIVGRILAMVAQRVIDRNARAKQRRCVLALQSFGNGDHKPGIGADAVRIAAVAVDTGALRRGTKMLHAARAPFAFAAGVRLPAESDALAHCQRTHTVANCRDSTHNLVAGDERILADAPVVRNQVKIAVADAAVGDADLHFLCPQFAWVVAVRQQFCSSCVSCKSLNLSHNDSEILAGGGKETGLNTMVPA